MIVGIISKWFLGGGVSALTDGIREMRKDALESKNVQARIDLESQIAKLEARRAVLVAESKSNWNVVVRGLFAAPFILFLWKVIVYDKVLGLGSTDNLSPDLWNIMMIVIAFYFVYETSMLFKKGN